MDDEFDNGAQALADAAVVHAACRRIEQAMSALQARPLDECAAAQMREALGGPTTAAQAALLRLTASDTDPGPLDGLTRGCGGTPPQHADGRPRRADGTRRCTTVPAGGAT